VLDHAGLGEEAEAVMAAARAGRRAEAAALIDRHFLDRLGVVYEDELAAGLERWSPLADRLCLSVPWYGMSEVEQLDAARRVIERIAHT
jgi:hypothetical protein